MPPAPIFVSCRQDGCGRTVAKQGGNIGLVFPWQGTRGDIRRKHQHCRGLPERKFVGGKLKSAQEGKTGGIDVVGCRRAIRKTQSLHHQRRGCRKGLVGNAASAKDEINVLRRSACFFKRSFAGRNRQIYLAFLCCDEPA